MLNKLISLRINIKKQLIAAFILIGFTSAIAQKDLDKYIPTKESSEITHPTIEIRTIVHIVQSSEAKARNLTKDSMNYLNQQFDWINGYYKNLQPPTLKTLDGVTHYIPDARIKFVVDQVLFHVDSLDWDRIRTVEVLDDPIKILDIRSQSNELIVQGKWRSKMFRTDDSLKLFLPDNKTITLHYTAIQEEGDKSIFKIKETVNTNLIGSNLSYYKEINTNCDIGIWEKYTNSDKNALHVFYTGSSKSGIAFGCGPTYYFLNVSNIIKGGDWAGAQLTAHELGHTIGLQHTDYPQFTDLPKKDKFGFIPCNETETSSNIMGYNVCRNYLSPMQVGYVHLQYTLRKDRILLTYANEYIPNKPIEIWDSTNWDKGMVIRQDIVVRRGQTLVINEQVHMATGASIYLEPKARLILQKGTVTNFFETPWQGVVICKSFERKTKKPCKAKNYGEIITKEGKIENSVISDTITQ